MGLTGLPEIDDEILQFLPLHDAIHVCLTSKDSVKLYQSELF